MTAAEALAFVRKHGVVLEAATGPVPSLASAIAGAPIRGSWWSHAKGREIFKLTRAVRDSPDILVCRLVDGKVTYVHRRLWAALVCASKRFRRFWAEPRTACRCRPGLRPASCAVPPRRGRRRSIRNRRDRVRDRR